MVQKPLLSVLTAVTQAPATGPDTYVTEGPLIQQPFGDIAFGGSVISQAISAAAATVAPEFDVYSSQASFLRPVKASAKVAYHVNRAADGRTFAIRAVQATQGSRGPCYIALISFQKRGSTRDQDGALRYADPPPDLGGLHPDDVPRQDLQQLGFHVRDEERKTLSNIGVNVKEPFEWRLLPFKPAPNPSQIRTYGFVRCPLPAAGGATHLASMGFLSDQSLLELSIIENWESVEEIRSLAMSTTLNSHISFHVPEARGAAWLICESRTSWGAGGRIATHQRFWDFETGALVMPCTQDAFIGRQQPQL
ncbi:hypothetical protein SLS62_003608 [Diatrype stigma]|uniref:Acyl-CoA thioesterase n=1 Tax=Diatrype stigma TaxID=117547 RepID=A0AAN9UXZ8_9PEZI